MCLSSLSLLCAAQTNVYNLLIEYAGRIFGAAPPGLTHADMKAILRVHRAPATASIFLYMRVLSIYTLRYRRPIMILELSTESLKVWFREEYTYIHTPNVLATDYVSIRYVALH